MTDYCLIEDGSITQGPGQLPSFFQNMTSFNLVDHPSDFGWFPFIDPGQPDFDPTTQSVSSAIVIDSTAKTITKIYTVNALSSDQIAANQAAAAIQAAQQTYNSMISAGLVITSTGTPSVNATYAIDTDQQSVAANLALYIAVNSRFPGGLPSVSLRTIGGSGFVQIPTTTLMMTLATTIADYVALCDTALVSAQSGLTPTWPSAPSPIT